MNQPFCLKPPSLPNRTFMSMNMSRLSIAMRTNTGSE